MAAKKTFGGYNTDDVAEYLRDETFYANEEELNEFLTDDEYFGGVEAPTTDELGLRHQEYADRCVKWVIARMCADDRFDSMLTEALRQNASANNYDMFTATVRDYLDEVDADRAFWSIKEEVIATRTRG